MERHELTELHFITPIENLPSIMARGILCHRRAAALAPTSIAMAEVQDRRRIKKVPQGRALHDYANLYVNARNPMLYKRLSQRHEICVLSVSPDVLDIPGTVVSDQNAASDSVRFAAAPAGLSVVDKAATFAAYWTHPDDLIAEWRHKAQMCAEVLVPDCAPATHIKGAYVASSQAHDAVNALNVGLVRSIRRCFSHEETAMTNITVRTGDMFGSEAQTLVNTVNCVGVMGKGIALAFKERFPEMYKDYVARCKVGKVRLGEPYLYTQLVGPWVLNFPTKDHWRSVSKLSDIVEGLRYLEAHYWEEWRIASLAVPPLGCGHGQLEWRVVGRLSTGTLAASTSPSNSTRRTARPLSRWTRPSSPGRTRSRSRSGKA